MSVNLDQVREQLEGMGRPAMNDFDLQSLRILRSAARALMAAGDPDSLCFKAGDRPGSGGLSASQLALAAQAAVRGGGLFLMSADH